MHSIVAVVSFVIKQSIQYTSVLYKQGNIQDCIEKKTWKMSFSNKVVYMYIC